MHFDRTSTLGDFTRPAVRIAMTATRRDDNAAACRANPGSTNDAVIFDLDGIDLDSERPIRDAG